MFGTLLKGLAYAGSLAVVVLLLFSSPYHREYGSHAEDFPDGDSILFGCFVSLLLLSAHGAGLLVQAYGQQKPLRSLVKSLNLYFTLFYLLSLTYWLYFEVALPTSA